MPRGTPRRAAARAEGLRDCTSPPPRTCGGRSRTCARTGGGSCWSCASASSARRCPSSPRLSQGPRRPRPHRARPRRALLRIVLLFAALRRRRFVLNVVSGLRYTRVSAEILFDMRLDVYRHLQRLSPRFFARTPPRATSSSRINSDIGEIQRVAAESGAGLGGQHPVPRRQRRDARRGSTGGCSSLTARGAAPEPLARWCTTGGGSRRGGRRARPQRRHRQLPHRDAAGAYAGRGVQRAGRARPAASGSSTTGFIDALMAMQRVSYLSGGLPGVLLSLGASAVFLYGGWRVIDGTLTLGTFVAFIAYQMRRAGARPGADGALHRPWPRPRCRGGACSSCWTRRST